MIGRKLTIGLLSLALGVISLSCNADDDASRQVNGKKVTAEEVVPFTSDQLPRIQGNAMHEQHFIDEVSCGDCHLSTEPMPIAHANETCQLCHEQAVPSKIWENHCLTCHHFTQADQAAASDPVQLIDSLCGECHNGHENGDKLYASCAHAAPDGEIQVTCDRCHQPHRAEPIDRTQLCSECHPEHTDTRHLATDRADCSLCHRPHHPQESGAELCTKCHSQTDDVLVHQVTAHPDDCMECHPPHAVTVEGEGLCADCHEEMAYQGSMNQPAQHKDCANCHAADTFEYRGNQSCANCHKAEGKDIWNKDVPSSHRSCLSCHPPHTWESSRQRDCTYCHEAGAGLEHTLEQHPTDCKACHNAHNPGKLPASGDCAGCHADGLQVPSFDAQAHEMHMSCANCHEQAQLDIGVYDFVGADSSCMLCHATALDEPELGWDDVPASHQYCMGCHDTHTWDTKSEAESCAACHTDISVEAPNELHARCSNCHAPDHGLEFQGAGASCKVCHAEPPGAHSSPGHLDCMNCHAAHEFTADTEMCTMCHADKVEDHYYDPEAEIFCVDCHMFNE